MSKLIQFSVLSMFLGLVMGCGGGGTATGPTPDESAKNNAQMEADMKTMMQQVPKKPK